MTHKPDKNGMRHPLSSNLSDAAFTWTDCTDHEARAAYLAAPKPEPNPLTPEEVAELDSYGPIRGYMMLPAHCIELWERELMWGKTEPEIKITRIPFDTPYVHRDYRGSPIEMVSADELRKDYP